MECDGIYKALQDYRAKKEELRKDYERKKNELENNFINDNKAIELILEKEILRNILNKKNLMEFLDKKEKECCQKLIEKEKELEEVNNIKKMFNLDKVKYLGPNKSNSAESMELEGQDNGEDIMKKYSDEAENNQGKKEKNEKSKDKLI